MFKKFTLLVLVACLVSPLLAQEAESTSAPAAVEKPSKGKGKFSGVTPQNMWEIGVHGGRTFVAGDVQSLGDIGFGLSVRKATDHVFSLRGDFLMASIQGDDENPAAVNRIFEGDYMAVTGFGVFSFNSFRFDKSVRTTNFYGMVGAGANNFTIDYSNEDKRNQTIDNEWAPHAAAGAGIAFRLGKRVNIGIEHQAHIAFGRRSDLIDGTENESGVRTPFRDIVNYTAVKLNFNIGNSSKLSEPLYWVNPLDVVMDDIQQLKNRPQVSLDDTDGDGVLDALDQEPNTEPSALVDTKGRTLDSDRDGVPDHRDMEPYYPPRDGEEVNDQGIVMNPVNRGGVTEDRVRELIDEALQNRPVGGGAGGGAVGGTATVEDWFLPMVHFATGSSKVKFSDYGTLAGISRMMKSNSNLRIVVTGHTDQTGGESMNDRLSYERARAVVDHLVDQHGIGRGRLVLRWEGKAEALVPSNNSYMNRRVEFRSATPYDVEMDPPAASGSGY